MSDAGQSSFATATAGMRAIDLTCLLLSPIAAGFLMTYTNISTAILAITAWNVTAWAPECYLLQCAQRFSAVLRSAPHSLTSYLICVCSCRLAQLWALCNLTPGQMPYRADFSQKQQAPTS